MSRRRGGEGAAPRACGGQALDPHAIDLAVAASVRHRETDYDDLLMSGVERSEARERVRDDVEHTLDRWRRPASPARSPDHDMSGTR